MAMRDAASIPELSEQLVAALDPADRPVAHRWLDAARHAAGRSRARRPMRAHRGARARLRASMRSTTEHRGAAGAGRARRRARSRGERFSIDADYVFATGAIPGSATGAIRRAADCSPAGRGFAGAADRWRRLRRTAIPACAATGTDRTRRGLVVRTRLRRQRHRQRRDLRPGGDDRRPQDACRSARSSASPPRPPRAARSCASTTADRTSTVASSTCRTPPPRRSGMDGVAAVQVEVWASG